MGLRAAPPSRTVAPITGARMLDAMQSPYRTQPVAPDSEDEVPLWWDAICFVGILAAAAAIAQVILGC
jgi:hypothetical protein